ncbi:hypothetical protein [Demequina sp. NBRC 110056]|uniref:hypothetical protein n=1 Tax=Demequina sp. NBRC 110056 TaxID=1570345 RepID=UPI00117C8B21|nr:hypothetical protein [Demequina sp. NBRC 110056]
MANATPPDRPSPWHSVHGGPTTSEAPPREPVAPSKPPAPTTGSIPVIPQPIEADDAELVAPVPSPPREEIMPTAAGALWDSVPPPASEPATATHDDPFRTLGDAAVRSASLQASGAQGGLSTSSAGSRAATAAAPGAPSAPAPVAAATPPDHEDPPAPVSPEPLPAGMPEIADDGPAYTPPFGVAVGAVSAGDADTEPGTGADDGGSGESADTPAEEHEPWFRSTAFLVIVGLLVMGGIGYGLFLLLAPKNETVELTPPVLVEPAATATLDPIVIEEPTAFQAAMPGTVGAFAMTELAAVNPQQAGLTVRAAEVDDLVYSDGVAQITLRAIQHYDAEAATAQFEALAADGTDRAPVEAGGASVGERATVPGETGDTIVWRNGTAVFVLAGPAEELEEFYSLFPL